MNWQKSDSIQEIAQEDHLLIIYGTNSFANNLNLNNILTQEELNYSERLRGPGQKDTWLSCRATLRLFLTSYLSTNPQIIELKKGRFGKLYVDDCKLSFNVSHSNSSFLLGFNLLGRIGVDIEKLSGREDLPSLIRYAFSDDEAAYCNNGNLAERFTEVWTLKEAFLKAVGVGLVDQLPSISVIGPVANYICRFKLNQESFLCPNGETGSIFYRKDQPIKYIWLI